MNYILKITSARQANGSNENRAERPQRIVILITASSLFFALRIYVPRCDTKRAALSSGRLSNVQRRASLSVWLFEMQILRLCPVICHVSRYTRLARQWRDTGRMRVRTHRSNSY